MASITVSTTAPRNEPTGVRPPNSTSTRKNTDRLKLTKSELMYWFCCATRPPAMPQVMALIANARILKR
ncbi:hypothetical protein D3C78_1816620 [compost metagenome]